MLWNSSWRNSWLARQNRCTSFISTLTLNQGITWLAFVVSFYGIMLTLLSSSVFLLMLSPHNSRNKRMPPSVIIVACMLYKGSSQINYQIKDTKNSSCMSDTTDLLLNYILMQAWTIFQWKLNFLSYPRLILMFQHFFSLCGFHLSNFQFLIMFKNIEHSNDTVLIQKRCKFELKSFYQLKYYSYRLMKLVKSQKLEMKTRLQNKVWIAYNQYIHNFHCSKLKLKIFFMKND